MEAIFKTIAHQSIEVISNTVSKVYLTIHMLSVFFILSCSSENELLSPSNDPSLSIPDAHFEKILIEQGIDSDSIINQKILKTDAEKVSQLNLNFDSSVGKISDLTGIEGFINLTDLSAIQHDIASINLTHNIKLETLFLQGNYLTNIDLSKNANLILVNLQSNLLHSISGLANAPNLKRLDLSFNNLEVFEISNGSLENLLISHNLLKSIDVHGSTSLKSIFIVTNNLNTLDLSSITLLETLIISDNKLQNINLKPLNDLTHFYASSNSLVNLDVSSNQKLVDLRVDRNPELTCIKIHPGQEIPTVSIKDYQELNSNCN